MEIESNGTYDLITNGVQRVPVKIHVTSSTSQPVKDVTITSNTTTTIVPDDGYDSMSSVVVDTNVVDNDAFKVAYVGYKPQNSSQITKVDLSTLAIVDSKLPSSVHGLFCCLMNSGSIQIKFSSLGDSSVVKYAQIANISIGSSWVLYFYNVKDELLYIVEPNAAKGTNEYKVYLEVNNDTKLKCVMFN